VFANSEHPTLPHLHHKLDQAASENLSIQSPTAKTAIPEAKMYVGGDCSAQGGERAIACRVGATGLTRMVADGLVMKQFQRVGWIGDEIGPWAFPNICYAL